jgi:hypothetical protein
MRFDIPTHVTFEQFVKSYGHLVQMSDAEAKEKKLKELYDKNVPAEEVEKPKSRNRRVRED